jgi:CheY-like chemotaxis protein
MKPILVVDDNPENAELLRIVLGRAGYDVAVADGPSAALASIAARMPVFAFLDLHMPEENNGLDLARTLKGDPATAGIVLVALTGSVEEGGQVAAKEAGFDGFMTKPIDTRTLPDTVASYLESRRG